MLGVGEVEEVEVADTEGEMLMAEVASIDIMASSPGEVRTSG